MKLRRCTKCLAEKPLTGFYKNKSMPGGFHYWCKPCHGQWQKTKYGYDSEYREQKRKKWRENNLMKKYGLTPLQYDLKSRFQHDACAICRTPAVEFEHRLCVDHNHKTGKVRGLLCDNCNMIVGVLENKLLREAAEDYLSIHQ